MTTPQDVWDILRDALPADAVIWAQVQTGGGCMATEIHHPDGGYILLTDAGGTTVPAQRPADTHILLGYYPPDFLDLEPLGYLELALGGAFRANLTTAIQFWWVGVPVINVAP